ncbi:hypothetical protein KKF91_19610 [Myxococcota bacterium]|nr:hypothetical protein [Myxococcota bacterium]MBU1432751.1 hypothetical protein [Myxococcota bacterium]
MLEIKTRPATPAPSPPLPEIYIYRDVLDELRFNGGWRAPEVAMGLIVGRAFEDEWGRVYLEVEGFVGATHVTAPIHFIHELRSRWKSTQDAQRYHLPEGEILGWFLAAPQEDAAPDEHAALIHNTFFTKPWQRGLWITPSSLAALRPTEEGLAPHGAALIAQPTPPTSEAPALTPPAAPEP